MDKDTALELALEALKLIEAQDQGCGGGVTEAEAWRSAQSIARKAITAIKQACAAPVQDNICNNALREQGKAYPRTCKKCKFGPCIELAQQALDKKAENARELGLDYEPVWDNLPSNKDVEDAMRLKRLNQLTSPQAQRKPLSNEQIGQAARDAHIAFCLNKHQTYEHALTRAIEAAHGITGKQK